MMHPFLWWWPVGHVARVGDTGRSTTGIRIGHNFLGPVVGGDHENLHTRRSAASHSQSRGSFTEAGRGIRSTKLIAKSSSPLLISVDEGLVIIVGGGRLRIPTSRHASLRGTMSLIDFSARTIPPHLIKETGYDGVVVYVSESRPGSNFGAKPVIREYADDLRAPGQVYPLHPGHQTGQ
jgi:hypothetical protein